MQLKWRSAFPSKREKSLGARTESILTNTYCNTKHFFISFHFRQVYRRCRSSPATSKEKGGLTNSSRDCLTIDYSLANCIGATICISQLANSQHDSKFANDLRSRKQQQRVVKPANQCGSSRVGDFRNRKGSSTHASRLTDKFGKKFQRDYKIPRRGRKNSKRTLQNSTFTLVRATAQK